MFVDPTHLNCTGAIALSRAVAAAIGPERPRSQDPDRRELDRARLTIYSSHRSRSLPRGPRAVPEDSAARQARLSIVALTVGHVSSLPEPGLRLESEALIKSGVPAAGWCTRRLMQLTGLAESQIRQLCRNIPPAAVVGTFVEPLC